MSVIRKIAVDLTPLLVGGENGGAKVFILELLKLLGKMHKNCEFILLTRKESNEELSLLDAANMRRIVVYGNGAPLPLIEISAHNLKHDYSVTSFFVNFKKYFDKIKSSESQGSDSLIKGLGVDLLFCPFTAMTYADSEVPTVCTLYDWQHRSYPQFFDPAEVAHRDQILEIACNQAAAIALISNFSKNDTLKFSTINISRLRTIYLKISRRTRPSGDEESQIMDSLELMPNQYFLYPANFWKHKNHEILFMAFLLARQNGLSRDIKLVCTGALGDRSDFLINAAKKMGLEHSVLFPGYLSTQDLSVIMLNAMGLVFPSLYEGFGLPPIEAMSLGIPVICSSSSSLPEIVSDAAILIDPRRPKDISEALISISKDQAIRNRYVELGKKRADFFSDSLGMAKEYWDLFEYAVDNPNKKSVLTGIYDDGGWLKERFKVHIWSVESLKELQLLIEAPPLGPHKKIKLEVRYPKDKGCHEFFINKGTTKIINIPLKRNGAIEFFIKSTFVPDLLVGNGDKRKLSLILKSCLVTTKDGNNIKLYSEAHLK